VLAWGNSIGDLATNLAMARRGLSNMAMTACFASPLFNLLMGLGLGFLLELSDHKQTRIPVALSGSVILGASFIMLNCAAIVAVSVWHRHHLPEKHGLFMVTLYILFVCASLYMAF
jgi:solute carrier family 24 (sodium/potassium/calcium exchanger), member 6